MKGDWNNKQPAKETNHGAFGFGPSSIDNSKGP
jgi:hypothetical protein